MLVTSIFSLFRNIFKSLKIFNVVKSRNCVVRVKDIKNSRRQILDSSKLKQFADDNFKLDENGRKLSKRVENTVGKGEIARYEQFLLFPVFSKGLFPRGVKRCHCLGMC